MGETELARAVERFVTQVGHWEAPRWATGGRADRTFAVVQWLADAGADAEGEPRRVVPRLGHGVLPDQVRVLAADLLAARPADTVLADAAQRLAELSRTL